MLPRRGARAGTLLLASLVLVAACKGRSRDGSDPPGEWESIIGIPDPPIGIATSHAMFEQEGRTYDYGDGPEPYRVGPCGPYTHYVDHDHPDATDTDNPFGTHERPRVTVPDLSDLPAGSVVEIHGGTFEGPGGVTGSGTADAPIFVRGAPGDEPIVTGGFRIYGDYYVIENLEFDLEDHARNTITVGKYQEGARSHIVIRHNEFHGGEHVPTSSYQAVRILHDWNTTEVVHDIVVYDNHFHHIGDGRGEARYDAVAVSVDANAERVWVIDNVFHHIGGDAIQIACDAPEMGDTYVVPHHVYIGRNRCHANYENFVDLKLCEDVIVSENVVSNESGLNPGMTPMRYGTGEHADLARYRSYIWTLYNVIHDVASEDGAIMAYERERLPYPDEHYFIGNIVYNCHNEAGTAPAFGSWNIRTAYWIHNVAFNCDRGLSIAGDRFGTDPDERQVVFNNILGDLHPGTTRPIHLSFYAVQESLDRSMMGHNLLYRSDAPARISWGVQSLTDGVEWTSYSLEEFAAGLPDKAGGSLEADPHHLDAPGGDLRLAAGSPAIDAGAVHSYLETFHDRYGISIAVDLDGTRRPVDGDGDATAAVDIGAHEYVP
jgi:hypothetical protein